MKPLIDEGVRSYVVGQLVGARIALREEADLKENEAEKFAVLDIVRRLEELEEEMNYLLS